MRSLLELLIMLRCKPVHMNNIYILYVPYVYYEIKTSFCYHLMPGKFCGIALRISMVRQRDSMQPKDSLEIHRNTIVSGFVFVYPTIATTCDKAEPFHDHNKTGNNKLLCSCEIAELYSVNKTDSIVYICLHLYLYLKFV